MQIRDFEPCRVPVPLSTKGAGQVRQWVKLLGVSPEIQRGIPGFRVLWRPFLAHPLPYTRSDGTPGLRRKSYRVKSRWFPVIDGITEDEALTSAIRLAAEVYRHPIPIGRFRVDWEGIARSRGVQLKVRYNKPLLNKGTLDRAEALFALRYTPRQVAEALGVDRSTASRWRSRLRAQKGPESMTRGQQP